MPFSFVLPERFALEFSRRRGDIDSSVFYFNIAHEQLEMIVHHSYVGRNVRTAYRLYVLETHKRCDDHMQQQGSSAIAIVPNPNHQLFVHLMQPESKGIDQQ